MAEPLVIQGSFGEGGSAGSVALVLQALAKADDPGVNLMSAFSQKRTQGTPWLRTINGAEISPVFVLERLIFR